VWWIVYLPIVFVLLSFVDLFFSWPVSNDQRIALEVWANIALLNSVHVILFIPAFLSFNFRSFFMKSGDGLKYVTISLISFIFFYTVDGFSFGLFKSSGPGADALKLIGTLCIVILPPFHAIRQSYGMSRLMEDREHIAKYKWIDYSAYHILLFIVLIMSLSNIFAPDNSILGRPNIFIIPMLVSVFIFLVFTLISKSNTHKKLFQLRLLLWPLGFVSLPAGIMNAATHGVEYGYMSYKMRSFVKERWLVLVTFILVMLIVFLYGFQCIKMKKDFLKEPLSPLVLSMTTLLLAIVQVHYVIDTIFFSNKSVIAKVSTVLSK
jgi:hypothetical protein